MRNGNRPALVGVGVLAGALALAACGESAASDAAESSGIAAVIERDLEIMVEATGEVEPIRVVEVKSKASGEILAMEVETGDVVDRGDLLAQVDPRDVRNEVNQAEADLEVARARLAVAEARRERTAELQRANVVTEQEYESAALEAANARAQLVKAEHALALARERMGDVTIRAPISGTVIRRDVEAGQIIASASANISGGTTLLLMADLTEMQVRMLVDETDIGRIRPAQSARVRVDAYPEREFTGSILKIEPQAVVDQNVTMFPVLIHLDNREGLLKPGMTAHVQVEIARRLGVTVVPNAAVVGQRDMMSVGSLVGVSEDAIRAALQPPARTRTDENGEDPSAELAAGGDAAECMALFQRLRGGDRSNISEADRARLQECRQQFAGAGMRPGGGRVGAPAARFGEARPGLVFVKGSNGVEPRRVMLGVHDWDHTEVIEGVRPGERVVLISVARLQQQQQEMADRMRRRSTFFGRRRRGPGIRRDPVPAPRRRAAGEPA